MSDRGKDVSVALTEVRTVHSRALSAIYSMEKWGAVDTYDDPEVMAEEPVASNYPDRESFLAAWRSWSERRYAARMDMTDPDYDEMIAALQKVAELLEPWKKAGSRRRRR